MKALGHPILSFVEAGDWEHRLLRDDAAVWAAMQRAGAAVAAAVRCDSEEIGGFASGGRVLVLVGKGHNGGDALIAARELLQAIPGAHADVVFVFGERTLKPLARRAWRELAELGRDRVDVVRPSEKEGTAYELCLDGIFGFQFRSPLDSRTADVLRWADRLPIRLRAAVDLPSGLNEPGAFRADFTYATGIVKAPLLSCTRAGRLRYLDLGFFSADAMASPSRGPRVLTPEVLSPLAALRETHCDKRAYGHLLILGGSRHFPGAILMTVLAALRSGVGLVTAFVPESLVSAFAARAPEAMWVGWPETAAGSLAKKGRKLLDARIGKAAALAIGPGLGEEPETLALVSDIVKASPVPLLLDANALQPDIVRKGKAPRILTPHAGEFARISQGAELSDFCKKTGAVVLLKGPVTRIAASGHPLYHSFFGGPVLARGGSGDILAGLTGGVLAQAPSDPLAAACRGAVWHGRSADLLARARGQTSASVTQLIDFFPEALRDHL